MELPVLQQSNSRIDALPDNIQKVDNEPFWGRDGLTFADLVDVFNPMQHLPLVANYYREQTDDDASEGARLVGGLLFGGLLGGTVGVLGSIVNSAVRHETRYDVSEHLLAMANNSFSGSNSPLQVQKFNAPEINPFFANALEEYANKQPDTYSIAPMNLTHSQHWGTV